MHPSRIVATACAAAALTVLVGSTGAAQAPRAAPVVVAREVARIGEGEANEFSFGQVTGIALDAAGHLYVSDAQDHRVIVFDARGKQVAVIGRRGKGPGEFEHPTSLALGTDGSLWVREVSRVQRFTPERAGAPATKFAAVVGSIPMSDWTSTRPGVVDRDGRFHVPMSYTVTRVTPPVHVQTMQRLDAAGRIADSLVVPVYANAPAATARYSVSANSGRMLRGLNHVPFASVPVWISTPRGTIISGDGLSYTLRETDLADREVRRFTRTIPPVTIDAAERRDSLKALNLRIDSIPVPLAQVQGMPDDVKARKLPSHYPPYRELTVSREGTLWVRRWATAAEKGTSPYDLFAADGRFIGSVSLPAPLLGAPAVVVTARRAAGVSVDPETGLQTLVVFELPASVAGESSPRPRP